MANVELFHLSIGYNHKAVLTDICATIREGELTCLLGPNGVGKSTLLRTLASFQPQLSGQILIDGKDIDTYTTKELATVIGVVLTEKTDVTGMTVEDMVLLGRSPYTGFWGGYSDHDRQVANEAISTVGIESIKARLVATLSDGERQKVMTAKALAQQTPIIYLDEPTAFLDFPSKVETMRLLRRICRKMHKTVMLSTHDIDLALQLADTVWLVDAVKGIASGTPEDLALSGKLATFFENRGVTYEPTTGLFRAATDVVRSIRINGKDGARRALLEKALLRNGIKSDYTATAETIDITSESFILHRCNTTTECCDIATLLRALITTD